MFEPTVNLATPTVIDYLKKRLFLKFYLQSHNKYLEWKYKKNWIECEEYGFSYFFNLENEMQNHINDRTSLTIKSDSNNKNIRLKIIAEGFYENFIDIIELKELSEKPLTVFLNQIPYQSLDIYAQNIVPKYKSIEIVLENLDGADIEKSIIKTYPTLTELLNDRWTKEWDVSWNLKYLDDGKDELRKYIYSKISSNKLSDIMFFKANITKPKQFLKRIVYQSITSKYILSVLFWILLWTGKITETNEGYLQLKSKERGV